MLRTAFKRLRKPMFLDRDGICVLMLEITFDIDPDAFSFWLGSVLASTACMSQLNSFCSVFGKKSSISSSTDLRAITPMSSILRLLDIIIFMLAELKINNLLPIRAFSLADAGIRRLLTLATVLHC